MTLYDQMQNDFTNIVNDGLLVRIKYYTGSVSNTDWDDAQALTQSGASLWVSGIMFPVTSMQGTSEALLMAQGKLLMSDKKVFVPGTVATTPIMKIGLGSPVQNEHFLIPEGVICYPPVGSAVYKKLFVRTLDTGSFIGEYP